MGSTPPNDTRGIVDPAGMMRDVDFARYPAGPVLDGLVDWFWSVRWSLPPGVERRQRVLNHPGGHISIGTLDDSGPLAPADGRVYGVLVGTSTRHLSADGWTVAAKTTTGGLGVLLDGPAERATGRTSGLGALPALDGAHLVRRVSAETDQGRRIDLLRCALEDVVRRRDPDHVAQARQVAAIARTAEVDRSVRRVEELAESVNLSVRTLQRLFARHVGVSPAWVIRRWRIIDAIERARSAGGEDWPGWADVAADLGYSDQAHLTRDVRRHLGMTPREYLALAGGEGRAPRPPA